MMADDLSDWTCDRCGKLLFGDPDEGRYSIADDDEAKTGRHYSCHLGDLLKLDQAKANLTVAIGKAEDALKELQRRIRK